MSWKRVRSRGLVRLVAVWERSVRATNDFLPDAERDEEGREYPLLYMRK